MKKPDTFLVSPVSKSKKKKGETTHGFNYLFEGIMKVINKFADAVAEQRAKEKMPLSGRGPEGKGENAENFAVRETGTGVDFPNRE